MALLHNIKHNQVLHEKVVLLTVRTQDIPYVAETQRVEVEKLGKGFFRVAVGYGFMDEPDVPRALERCRAHAVPVDLAVTSYFVARETLIPSPRPSRKPARGRCSCCWRRRTCRPRPTSGSRRTRWSSWAAAGDLSVRARVHG